MMYSKETDQCSEEVPVPKRRMEGKYLNQKTKQTLLFAAVVNESFQNDRVNDRVHSSIGRSTHQNARFDELLLHLDTSPVHFIE